MLMNKIEIFLKKKTKSLNMVMNDITIFDKMKNKDSLSTEKNYSKIPKKEWLIFSKNIYHYFLNFLIGRTMIP